tara:strand:+ start:626 stop:1054 length:429 start_codon:yes stop_codon:yes gene_type:complete
MENKKVSKSKIPKTTKNLMLHHMKTIDSLNDTIAWLKDDLSEKKNAHAIYYEKIIEWVEIIKEKNKEIKKAMSDRNDAIRAYNGLIQLGKSAADLGIDIKEFALPEEVHENYKDYEFCINGKVLESGRTSYQMLVGKKKGKR